MTISIEKFAGKSKAYSVSDDFEIPILLPGGARVHEITVLDSRPPSQYTGDNFVFTSEGAGGVWSNPGNAEDSDDAYATATTTTAFLQAVNSPVFTAIPKSRVLKGITVNVEAKGDGGNMTLQARLVKNGAQVGDFIIETLTTGDVVYSMGGPTDLLNTGFDILDVTDPTFGVEVWVTQVSAGSLASVDHVEVILHVEQQPFQYIKGILPDATIVPIQAGGPVFYLLNEGDWPMRVWSYNLGQFVGTIGVGQGCVVLLSDTSTPDGRWHMKCRPFFRGSTTRVFTGTGTYTGSTGGTGTTGTTGGTTTGTTPATTTATTSSTPGTTTGTVTPLPSSGPPPDEGTPGEYAALSRGPLVDLGLRGSDLIAEGL